MRGTIPGGEREVATMIRMGQRFTALRARQNRKAPPKGPPQNMSVAGAFGSVIHSAPGSVSPQSASFGKVTMHAHLKVPTRASKTRSG